MLEYSTITVISQDYQNENKQGLETFNFTLNDYRIYMKV